MAVDFTRKDPPWVDVPDPTNPPAGASKIMASDLNRIEDAVESLAAESGAIEVDTSVGTKVTVGGHVVFYDSGWRRMNELLINDWTGSVQIRRVLDTLWVRAYGLDGRNATEDSFLDLPFGFNFGSSGMVFRIDGERVVYNASSQQLQLPAGVRYFGTGFLQGNVLLAQTFPTSLPGTPA